MKKYIKPQADAVVVDMESVLTTGSIEIGDSGTPPESALAPGINNIFTDDSGDDDTEPED